MSAARRHIRAAALAALTGMSIRTVRRWIADKTIPSTKLGGARLVAIPDLEALLQVTPDDPEEYDEESVL
jgi:excisionase family DNA binding protein